MNQYPEWPEVEFGDHQRYTILWSLSASIVMLLAAILVGVVPLFR